MTINVVKRNGNIEPLDVDKVYKVLEWASEGLDAPVSTVMLNAKIQFTEGVRTEEIHNILVKTAADLISTNYPDYQYLAARLGMFHLRKRVYGSFEPPSLYKHVKHVTDLGRYDPHILKDYNTFEFSELDSYIKHERDLDLAYAGFKQLEGKYLVQERKTKEHFETPQFIYMLVSMCLFAHYPVDTRMGYVKEFYDATSLGKISLPTPIMAGVRTKNRQFSSCVLIEAADTLDSINAASSSIVKYVSKKAGIGINAGAIRAEGSKIGDGSVVHTGCIPFYKYFQSAVKCCSQGGVRGGAATVFYPMWHKEFESLIVLKNNRGVEENRVRNMDYGVQLNKLMYTRLIKGEDITLFSPNDVEGLYEAFFSDQGKFEKLYLAAEKDESISKITLKASEAFSLLMQERASTGRIYIQNVDHCNTNSPFDAEVAPVKQSNLCLEVALPTKPLKSVEDTEGEVALCTLSAFNLGMIEDLSDFEGLSDLVVRALDSLLDYQDYQLPAAEKSSLMRRTLGVGVINFAYYLAKNGVRYSDGSANNLVHRTTEAIQYFLLKASNNLAKEQGTCKWYEETTYAKGILPIDRYKRDVDKLHTQELLCDWEELREDIKVYGLRNSTLTCAMPSETSSQVSNATNGIEPPRGYVSVKASKDGILKQVVPEFKTLKGQYELLWEIPSNKGYLELVAIMQKFMCQSLSANTNYDPTRYENGKVPMKVMLQDLLTAYKLGVKTLYYHNTRDGASDPQVDNVTPSGDNDCGDGCKI